MSLLEPKRTSFGWSIPENVDPSRKSKLALISYVPLISAAIQYFLLGLRHTIPSHRVLLGKKSENGQNQLRKKIGSKNHPWNCEIQVIIFGFGAQEHHEVDSDQFSIFLVNLHIHPELSVVREHVFEAWRRSWKVPTTCSDFRRRELVTDSTYQW